MATASCPDCLSPLTRRTNRTTGGTFLGCTNYPACRFTAPPTKKKKKRNAPAHDNGNAKSKGKTAQITPLVLAFLAGAAASSAIQWIALKATGA